MHRFDEANNLQGMLQKPTQISVVDGFERPGTTLLPTGNFGIFKEHQAQLASNT
jgi:hypothetical protein